MSLRIALAVLAAFGLISSHGFVTYVEGGKTLRWNVNRPGLNPNVVNPTTKAIRYYIASDAYSSSNRSAEIDSVRAAFDQWQLIPGANVRFEFAGFVSPESADIKWDGTNVVFWAKRSLIVGNGLQNLDAKRAWTATFAFDQEIIEADIVLNGIQFNWYTDFTAPNRQQPFVEGTVLHEIGHFLGLDHTPAGGATVLDGALGVASEVGLSADEIAAGRFLYPAPGYSASSIRGSVRANGSPILGAIVSVEDAAGNLAGATVTSRTGEYLVPSLPAGNYNIRVSPFDPATTSGLLHGYEIAEDYRPAVTEFFPTENLSISVGANVVINRDFNLSAGSPPLRILGLSKPTADPTLVTLDRTAVSIRQGQSNLFTGVASRSFRTDTTLTVSGDGVTLGPTQFLRDQFGIGLHALLVRISVSSNATPGLRTYVVRDARGVAYANGYLEVVPTVPDANSDALDDAFQRRYWSPWTRAESAPAANPDGDPFSNRYEYRTGSDPTNPASFNIRLEAPTRGRFGLALSWLAEPGKRYSILQSDRLSGWTTLGNPVIATNEVMAVTDAPTKSRFYRLQLLP